MIASLRPSIRYGQNFLINPVLVDYLLDQSSIGADDTVLEIGPGRGIITERLARRCRRVIAVEKDPCLSSRLRRRYVGSRIVTVQVGDILDIRLPERPYKVFANIPYNATTAIVTRLTTAGRAPDDAYLTMQREAAARFMGLPRATLYAALLAPWFEASIVHRFARSDFEPVPNVESVMLRLRKRGPPLVGRAEAQAYRDFVVHGFTACCPSLRKTFKGILTPAHLRAAEIDPDTTATDVPVAQWLALFDVYRRVALPTIGSRLAGSEQRLRRQQAALRKEHRTRIG